VQAAASASASAADVDQPGGLSLRAPGDRGDAHRHRLSDLLHDRAVFFKTPPSLQLKDKIFIGFDNYGDPHQRCLLEGHAQHRDLDGRLTFIAFILGLGAALALHRDFVGRGILRAMLLIPWVVSAVAASYVWKWLYHSDFGAIGAMAVQLGLASEPINFIDNVQTVAALADRRQYLEGILLRHDHADGGLQTVPDQLLRAAQVDGANAWQRFWHVTFPHLRACRW
jgi:multiple sugar transport system permease protein